MEVNSDKISVLYVDDEMNNLNSFKATLRMDYKIYIATNAGDAMHILSEHPEIEVIISDQRMPGQTGIEFFEEVIKKYPLPVRMLLTGYANIESVIDAINRGRVFRYITKPWNDFDLRSAIKEAYQYYVSNSLLKRKNEELQATYDELDRFSHSVTHDVRGPIVASIKAMEMVKGCNDVKEYEKLIDLMMGSMKYLDSYIMSTHSYHRMKEGSMEVSDVDLKALVDSIHEMYEVEKRVKGTDFQIDVHQEGNFRTDEVLLCMVIDNLLGNAFKYGKNEGAAHKVSLTINAVNGVMEMDISDNGVGIDATQVDKIFDLYYRGDGAQVAEGTGFGLYNVSKAIQKLDGDIRVSSEPGKGSTFKVLLKSLP